MLAVKGVLNVFESLHECQIRQPYEVFASLVCATSPLNEKEETDVAAINLKFRKMIIIKIGI